MLKQVQHYMSSVLPFLQCTLTKRLSFAVDSTASVRPSYTLTVTTSGHIRCVYF